MAVILQNLRDFTVQIRTSENTHIIGTGIIVSPAGDVVTCAHVVQSAGIKTLDRDSIYVGVYFPQLSEEMRFQRARIVAHFTEYHDDIVMLALIGSIPAYPKEKLPKFGDALDSVNNAFRTYGYRHLDNYLAGIGGGTILGSVESPKDKVLCLEPIQIESSQINRGMSGAPVLDIERNLVVGIISETWFSDPSGKDRDTAWVINADVLTRSPFNLVVQNAPIPLKNVELFIPEEPIQPLSTIYPKWYGAPPAISEWVGREEFIKQLDNNWTNSTCNIASLIGFGGEGKTSLARKWVEEVLGKTESTSSSPDGIFWWTFNQDNNNNAFDAFVKSALSWLGGAKIIERTRTTIARIKILGVMLREGRYIFVLDGMEHTQIKTGDNYGIFKDTSIIDLLTYFASAGHESFCLITSRIPIIQFAQYITHSHIEIYNLKEFEGRTLLKKFNVDGTDAELDNLVRRWHGHALTLSMIGRYISERHGGNLRDSKIFLRIEPGSDIYENIKRVLFWYDNNLSKPERSLMMVLEILGLPIPDCLVHPIFLTFLKNYDAEEFIQLINRLIIYDLLQYNPENGFYDSHPLVKEYYYGIEKELALETLPRTRERSIYESLIERIKTVVDSGEEQKIENLFFGLIEAIHYCRYLNEDWGELWINSEDRMCRRYWSLLVFMAEKINETRGIKESFSFPNGTPWGNYLSKFGNYESPFNFEVIETE